MDSIDLQINRINKSLNDLSKGLDYDIRVNKAIKRKAAKPLLEAMKSNAPQGETGKLKKSIRFLNLYKSSDVFVGAHARTAPHAHLVEFGFRHYRDGKKKEGTPFVRKSYEETKEEVLKNMIELAKKEFEKWGQKLSI